MDGRISKNTLQASVNVELFSAAAAAGAGGLNLLRSGRSRSRRLCCEHQMSPPFGPAVNGARSAFVQRNSLFPIVDTSSVRVPAKCS